MKAKLEAAGFEVCDYMRGAFTAKRGDLAILVGVNEHGRGPYFAELERRPEHRRANGAIYYDDAGVYGAATPDEAITRLMLEPFESTTVGAICGVRVGWRAAAKIRVEKILR